MKEKKNEEIKAITSQITLIESQLISELQGDGLDSIKIAGVGTCTLKTEDYPMVTDMSAFVEWCATNNMPELIQKRVSSLAFKDYVAEHNEYPAGVDTYVKETIGLRRS